jgi:hypothetical protein
MRTIIDNWNIVDRGIKHQNSLPLPHHIEALIYFAKCLKISMSYLLLKPAISVIKFACWKDYKCLCGRKIKPSREDQNYNMTEEKHCEDNETDDTITWKDICHILDAFFLRLYLIVIGSLTWYGSWIYNYLCNQCLSPLKLWVRIPPMERCTRYYSMWKN